MREPSEIGQPEIPIQLEPTTPRLTMYLLLALSGSGVVLALLWIKFRPLAWDEVEFARATAWVAEGRLPFRDFWEHHTPLQWFLFAPIAKWVSSPGVQAVQWLRLAQLPIWAWTLWFWFRRTSPESGWRAWAAPVLLGLTPLFTLGATEYRVDTLSTCLLLNALILSFGRPNHLQRITVGALIALAPLANLRMGPVAVCTFLAVLVLDFDSQRWRLRRESIAFLVGAFGVMAFAAAYLQLTHSWGSTLELAWKWNAWAAGQTPASSRGFWTLMVMPLKEWDPIPTVLLLGGLAGSILALRHIRTPSPIQAIAIAFLVNIVFIFNLNIHYHYHLQTPLLLSVPLFSYCLKYILNSKKINIHIFWTIVVLGFWVGLIQIVGLIQTRSEQRLAIQDQFMREAHRLTEPNETIWDGVGWVLHREPSSKYWFLPLSVRLAVLAGKIKPYSPQDILAAPPAAIILDSRVYNCLNEWNELNRFLYQNYAPRYPFLWFPTPSGVLDASLPVKEHIVLRSGEYRLVASEQLVRHPFFRAPYDFSLISPEARSSDFMVHNRPSPEPLSLRLWVDGLERKLGPERTFQVHRGNRLRLEHQSGPAVGFFVIPTALPSLFAPHAGPSSADPNLMSYF